MNFEVELGIAFGESDRGEWATQCFEVHDVCETYLKDENELEGYLQNEAEEQLNSLEHRSLGSIKQVWLYHYRPIN